MEGLIDTRDEYMEHIQDLLSIPISKRLYGIYNDCYENKKNLKHFQNELIEIRKWNNNLVTEEYKKIIKYTKCTYMNNLIKIIIISTIKIKIYEYKDQFDNIRIKIPNPEDFVHKCYINCAMFAWKNAYLFNRINIKDAEYQNNLNVIEENIRRIIKKTFRDFIPFEEIFLQIEENLTENIQQYGSNSNKKDKGVSASSASSAESDSDNSDDSDDKSGSDNDRSDDDRSDDDRSDDDSEASKGNEASEASDNEEASDDNDDDEEDKEDNSDDDEDNEVDEDNEDNEDNEVDEEDKVHENKKAEIKDQNNVELQNGYKDDRQDQVYLGKSNETFDAMEKRAIATEGIAHDCNMQNQKNEDSQVAVNQKDAQEGHEYAQIDFTKNTEIQNKDAYNRFETDARHENNVSHESMNDINLDELQADIRDIRDIRDDDTRSVISNISHMSDIKEIFIKETPKQSSKKPSFF